MLRPGIRAEIGGSPLGSRICGGAEAGVSPAQEGAWAGGSEEGQEPSKEAAGVVMQARGDKATGS